MGILDNDTVIVDAILTKIGRQKLAQGQRVNIDFYIKSREYKEKFYNTLMAKEIRIEDTSTQLAKESTPF